MIDISSNTDKYLENLDVVRLVSFPRTGSHWLRIMLELYLGAPCAPQKFFEDSSNDKIWGFHIHNRKVYNPHPSEGPCVNLKKVLYLHRDPVDTIYSQLKYDKLIPTNWNGNIKEENIKIEKELFKIVYQYRDHLCRWRFFKEDIESYFEITYEDLKENTYESLVNIINWIDKDIEINKEKLNQIIEFSNKNTTKKVTPHDVHALNEEIINNPYAYDSSRVVFKKLYSTVISRFFIDLRG